MRQLVIPKTLSFPAFFLAAALSLAGCASQAAPAQVAPATPPPPPPAAATAAPAAAAPTVASSGQPTSSGERVTGAVKSVDGDTITLADGKTMTIGPNTSIIRIQPATAADLKPQDYVAITAVKQSDGSLLASMINIFAESQRGLGAGQRPMTGGNLMTNATIATVQGDTFTATFPGGDANVKLAPDVKIQRFTAATPQDIKVGATISALVTNGVARNITLQ